MIKIEFSSEDIVRIAEERYHHPDPRVQKKLEVLWLKSQGLPHQDIERIGRVSENTMREYFRQYITGGIEALKQFNHKGGSSKLNEHCESIEESFRKAPPASLAEARERIKTLTGLDRSKVQVGIFIKKLGLKLLKSGHSPAKTDPE